MANRSKSIQILLNSFLVILITLILPQFTEFLSSINDSDTAGHESSVLVIGLLKLVQPLGFFIGTIGISYGIIRYIFIHDIQDTTSDHHNAQHSRSLNSEDQYLNRGQNQRPSLTDALEEMISENDNPSESVASLNNFTKDIAQASMTTRVIREKADDQPKTSKAEYSSELKRIIRGE